MALAYGVKEALCVRVNKPIPTLNDNRAAVFMATNSGSTKRAKHIISSISL